MGDRARRLVAALAVACTLAACGSDDDGAPPQSPVAVLNAFPAELAPLLAAAAVRESKTVEGRTFYLGKLCTRRASRVAEAG